jgi:PRTRC genetic system protein E
MFAELMPLLRKRRLLLTMSLVEGDTIRATVVPQKSSETEDSAITTPLAITGTAEELGVGTSTQELRLFHVPNALRRSRPVQQRIFGNDEQRD